MRKVIFSASPGSAPSTKTGPVTGLTLAKSSVATSADRRAALKVAVARVETFEVDRLAGLARQRRREIAAPGEIMVLAMDRIVAGDAHGSCPSGPVRGLAAKPSSGSGGPALLQFDSLALRVG